MRRKTIDNYMLSAWFILVLTMFIGIVNIVSENNYYSNNSNIISAFNG